MEKTEILNTKKQINAEKSELSGSTFHMVMINDCSFNDVAMKNCKIVNANLTELEIDGAQLGGAYIHNVGGPPVGHPAYDPAFVQRPLRFEDCNLNGTTITDCNLSNVDISDCNLTGMKINGILVDELLRNYEQQ